MVACLHSLPYLDLQGIGKVECCSKDLYPDVPGAL